MAPSVRRGGGRCATHDHVAKFLHLSVELGVQVVPLSCFRLTKVGSELLEAITQSFTFLMDSSLHGEEVFFGDEVALVILILEERVCRRIWPIHHVENVVSRKM